MNVTLSSEVEGIVRRKVERGLYPSADEVLCEALRLLDDRDRVRQTQLKELRSEIAIGIDESDRGLVAPFDPKATLERVREKRRAKGDSGCDSDVDISADQELKDHGILLLALIMSRVTILDPANPMEPERRFQELIKLSQSLLFQAKSLLNMAATAGNAAKSMVIKPLDEASPQR